MPLWELAEWIQKQVEQNPALQFAEEEPSEPWKEEKLEQFAVLEELDSSFQTAVFPEMPSDEPSWIEQIAAPPPSLHQHLLQQAREALSSLQQLHRMEKLIDSLDEYGFLSEDSSDSEMVELLQSFDPPGVGARSLQHALLLQLKRRGEKNLLAFRLIQDHYEDLLNDRKDLLCQKLSCRLEQLQSVIQHSLAPLSLNPAAPFQQRVCPVQTPDIFIEPFENGWKIILNEAPLPKFQVNSSTELSRFEPSARWIEKILFRRCHIITRIVQIILEIQSDFFFGKNSDLQPLTLRHVAHRLSLHESTVCRAVKGKYLSCPRGIFPLKYFFPHPISNLETSHHTAKERLKLLIERENKQKPLSDDQLSKALQAQGISCARRTIAKYRKSLCIPPVSLRRQKP